MIYRVTSFLQPMPMYFFLRVFLYTVVFFSVTEAQSATCFFGVNSVVNCSLYAESPLSDIPNHDDGGESMPFDSEETEEELKEISLLAELRLNLFLSDKSVYFTSNDLVFNTPYRNIFSPPPEFLS